MRFNTMRAFLGLFAVLTASTLPAQNSTVDNFSGGTDENLFENYWYYYDDNGGTKADDRPQAAPQSTPSVINVPYGYKHRHASNNPNDTFLLKEYRFLIKDEAGNKYGSMPFTYGAQWKATGYTAWPFVGIGTELAPDGKFIDLTGATEITFKLRSHVNDLSVDFRIETMDIIRDSSFAYFKTALPVLKGVWTDCKVVIPTDLIQPGWAVADQKKASFLQTQAAKLAWEVHAEFNNAVASDTLDVDDIVIKNYDFVSPSIWTKTAPARPVKGLFSDFEGASKNATPFSTYWYAYDDHEATGNSSITQGTVIDTGNKLLALDFKAGSGFCNGGYGPAIQMKIGKTIRKTEAADTSNVQGFVGIGLSMYDSAGGVYFNSTTGKMGTVPLNSTGGSANGIYFEYLADGDFRYLTVEVLDMNDVPDKSAPLRKESRGPGIVWYRNIPLTGINNWRRVEIPFDSLIIHSTWKGYKDIPLDRANLAKIQFKVQGAEKSSGVVQIDNVFFPGIDFGLKEGVVNGFARNGRESAFRAFYSNRMIRVRANASEDFKRGEISLVDLRGTVVTKIGIANGSKHYYDFSADWLPAGVYYVKLSGTDVNGRTALERAPVTIMK